MLLRPVGDSAADPDDPDVPGEVCDHPVIGQIVRVPKTIPEIIALFFFLMHVSPFIKNLFCVALSELITARSMPPNKSPLRLNRVSDNLPNGATEFRE